MISSPAERIGYINISTLCLNSRLPTKIAISFRNFSTKWSAHAVRVHPVPARARPVKQILHAPSAVKRGIDVAVSRVVSPLLSSPLSSLPLLPSSSFSRQNGRWLVGRASGINEIGSRLFSSVFRQRAQHNIGGAGMSADASTIYIARVYDFGFK